MISPHHSHPTNGSDPLIPFGREAYSGGKAFRDFVERDGRREEKRLRAIACRIGRVKPGNAVEMGNDSVEEANDERTSKGGQKRRQETTGLFECRSHQAEHSRREHDACRESQKDVVEAMRDFSEGEA